MKHMKKVLLAFSDGLMAAQLRTVLEQAGFCVCRQCAAFQELVDASYENEEEYVAVTQTKLGRGSITQYAPMVSSRCEILLLLAEGEEYMGRATGLLALPLPTTPTDLVESVEMLFETMPARLSQEARTLPPKPKTDEQRELERKVVTEAKEVLMRRNQMTEEQAHRFIQKRSMDSGARMAQIASHILSTDGDMAS